jgi:hypothetical protein
MNNDFKSICQMYVYEEGQRIAAIPGLRQLLLTIHRQLFRHAGSPHSPRAQEYAVELVTLLSRSTRHAEESVTSAPVLHYFGPSLHPSPETDAPSNAIAVVFSLRTEDEIHSVEFYSRTLNGAELNYNVHDKAFKVWRHSRTINKNLQKRKVRAPSNPSRYIFRVGGTVGRCGGA